jgi:hypothetical protein
MASAECMSELHRCKPHAAACPVNEQCFARCERSPVHQGDVRGECGDLICGGFGDSEVDWNRVDISRGQHDNASTGTSSAAKANAITDRDIPYLSRCIHNLPGPFHADHEGNFRPILVAASRHQQVGEIERGGMHAN